jgi:hypothetical protein
MPYGFDPDRDLPILRSAAHALRGDDPPWGQAVTAPTKAEEAFMALVSPLVVTALVDLIGARA